MLFDDNVLVAIESYLIDSTWVIEALIASIKNDLIISEYSRLCCLELSGDCHIEDSSHSNFLNKVWHFLRKFGVLF